MADFLSRVAARAMGATALAEPRMPDRFSPGAEQTAHSLVHGGAVPANDGAEDAGRRGQDWSQEERRSSSAAHGSEAELATRGHIASRGGESVARQSVVRAGEISLRPVLVGSVDPEPHVDREPRKIASEPGRTGLNDLGEARERAAEGPRYVRQEPPPTWPAFAEPLSAPPFARSGEAARSVVRDLPSYTYAGTASPTVRITIGRIDVRAERPSPAPVPVPRTRPSTVSLDQFLKQSAGAR